MKTSSGWPETWPACNGPAKFVLNALTTLAALGATWAISSAADVPGAVNNPAKVAMLTGLVMSTSTLPSKRSPYSVTSGTTAAYGTARITTAPAGSAPTSPVLTASGAANSAARRSASATVRPRI